MSSDKFKGIVVCFTGFRDQSASNYILENGGGVTAKVDWRTTYLVCKNKNRITTKMRDAMSKGVKIMDLEDFNKTFGWAMARPLLVPGRKEGDV